MAAAPGASRRCRSSASIRAVRVRCTQPERMAAWEGGREGEGYTQGRARVREVLTVKCTRACNCMVFVA